MTIWALNHRAIANFQWQRIHRSTSIEISIRIIQRTQNQEWNLSLGGKVTCLLIKRPNGRTCFKTYRIRLFTKAISPSSDRNVQNSWDAVFKIRKSRRNVCDSSKRSENTFANQKFTEKQGQTVKTCVALMTRSSYKIRLWFLYEVILASRKKNLSTLFLLLPNFGVCSRTMRSTESNMELLYSPVLFLW